MAKIPFNVKFRPQIESGEYKVILDCNIEVEILAWDKPGDYPIVCMAKKDEAIPFRVNNNGKAYHFPEGANYSDLFIVTPEEELSDWEKAVGLALTDYQLLPRDKDGVANIHDINEFTKKKAVELLALAKEECKNQIENDYREIIHGAYEKGKENALKDLEESGRVHCKSYDIGYDDGARDALKDLPRWKKSNGKERFNERLIVLAGDNDLLCTNYAEKGEYYISFSDLEKLPKEG